MATENTEQYREFITKLQREEQRPAALNDIKNLFVLKSSAEVSDTIRSVGISKIVHCLNVPDKNQTDLACDVLKLCFGKFNIGDIVRYYTSHIMYLLRHEKSCVRRLAIDEVHKAVTTDINLLPVPQYIDVFVATAQLVMDTDVGVANQAIKITSNLPTDAYPKVLEEMKIALDYDSSSKCNAFEVVVNISTKSYDLFKLCADLNYIDFMALELGRDDILYQVNILELLSSLVVTPHGVNYLVQNGILNNIAKIMKNCRVSILTPGYVKFFGTVAHHYPREIFDKYPVLLETVFDGIEHADDNILPVALDTLGFIAATNEGKLCLAAIGSKYTQAVERIGMMIRNAKTDIKVRALHCFANLIGIENERTDSALVQVDHRTTLMTREWFRSLSDQPSAIQVLFELCKNPFPDIRLAAFALLESVSQHMWGQELVMATAGFIEYLLDRTVDHTKDLKEFKYDIIKRLSNSPAADSNTRDRLKTYVERGPFYSPAGLEVAMEDGD